MPVLYWLALSAYIGGAMIGFVNCDAYRKWQEKSEREQAAIVEAALESEADSEEAPKIVIITEGVENDD